MGDTEIMILEIIKLLLAKDTRDAVAEAFRALKQGPEWQKDLIDVEETFTSAEANKARILIKFLCEILLGKGWRKTQVGVAEFAIQEVVDNAFIHGVRSHDLNDFVQIHAVLSRHWVDCQVTDTGPGFNLSEILKAQASGERRGLSKVKDVVARLAQSGSSTIEVRIECNPGKISLLELDDIYVLNLEGELTSSSVNYDKEAAAIDASIPAESKLVIDLTGSIYICSAALRFLMLINRANLRKGGRTVLVSTPDSGVRGILEVARYMQLFQCADTRGGALEMLQSRSITRVIQRDAQADDPASHGPAV